VSEPPVFYYVYYRVAAARARAARRAIRAVLGSIEQRTGVAGRLLRRQDEPLLWMEVYENVRDPLGFEKALDALLDEYGFGSLLASGSQRKIERFVAPD